MCEYCEHFQPILENENSLVFMVGNRLILQDKTSPKLAPSFFGTTNEAATDVFYESTWKCMKETTRCPFCGKELMFTKQPNAKEQNMYIVNEAQCKKYSTKSIHCLPPTLFNVLENAVNLFNERIEELVTKFNCVIIVDDRVNHLCKLRNNDNTIILRITTDTAED